MSRVKMSKRKQKEFLEAVAESTGLSWQKIANLSNICQRTLRDWRRGKFNMRYEALCKLHRISKVPLPEKIEILPEYWSTKKASNLGAIRRNRLYGNPGTMEGRRKGGLTTSLKFRNNPEFAKMIGFKLRTKIFYPSFSPPLAEFIGIVLGDGYIKSNMTQVGISFNAETDNEYAAHVQKMIGQLFNVSSSISLSSRDKSGAVIISSRNLVEFLISRGLKRGNKVRNKVNIPKWIWDRKDYMISCLRGLMDTDGSFYAYKHKVFDRIYYNCALCLTNYSKPLLKSSGVILTRIGFTPVFSKNRLYLHKKEEIDKYFKEVGTNNSKHLLRYKGYLRERCLSPA